MTDKKRFIEIEDNKIAYTVVKTRRKTIGIIVERNGEVRVRAPFRVSENQIFKVVQKKADWILRKVNEAAERSSSSVERKFASGEKLLYLGDEYILETVEKDLAWAEVIKTENTVAVYIPGGMSCEIRKQTIKKALEEWYRKRFSEIVKERVDRYSLRLKVFPRKIAIKDQKTRWGSCSKKENINLNWRLVMAPVDIIDYVVVHELCHLKVMNHSKDFWNLVESILPNYHESRKWLKVNGNRLGI